MYFILTEVATPRIRAPPPVKRSKPLWGLSCGAGVPTKASKFEKDYQDPRQKLMLHGIGRNKRFNI